MAAMETYNTHGAYFAPPLLQVNAGGTHEQNPYEGVQLGVDPQGVPNLVEQDETIYNDYVFSDRLKPTASDLRNFVLPEKFSGKTFAQISKQLGKEIEQRPNDVLSNASLGVMLDRLTACQEDFKQRREEARIKRELGKMSPEQLMQLGAQLSQMQQAQQQGMLLDPNQGMPYGQTSPEGQMSPEEQAAMEQQAMMEQQAAEQQVSPEEQAAMQQMAMQGAPMMAYGGYVRRFDDGGPTRTFTADIPPYDPTSGLTEDEWYSYAQQVADAAEQATRPLALPTDAEGMVARPSDLPYEMFDPAKVSLNPYYVGQVDPAVVTANAPETQAFIDNMNAGKNQFILDAADVADRATLGFIPALSATNDLLHGDNTGAAVNAAFMALPFIGQIRRFDKAIRGSISEYRASDKFRDAKKAFSAAKKALDEARLAGGDLTNATNAYNKAVEAFNETVKNGLKTELHSNSIVGVTESELDNAVEMIRHDVLNNVTSMAERRAARRAAEEAAHAAELAAATYSDKELERIARKGAKAVYDDKYRFVDNFLWPRYTFNGFRPKRMFDFPNAKAASETKAAAKKELLDLRKKTREAANNLKNASDDQVNELTQKLTSAIEAEQKQLALKRSAGTKKFWNYAFTPLKVAWRTGVNTLGTTVSLPVIGAAGLVGAGLAATGMFKRTRRNRRRNDRDFENYNKENEILNSNTHAYGGLVNRFDGGGNVPNSNWLSLRPESETEESHWPIEYYTAQDSNEQPATQMPGQAKGLNFINSNWMQDYLDSQPWSGKKYSLYPQETTRSLFSKGYEPDYNVARASKAAAAKPAEDAYTPPVLNTGLRYAGAIQSGLGALASVLQKPDRTLQNGYNRMADNLPMPSVTYRPQFVNTRYNPVDTSMATAQLLANANASRRSAMNSGAGPATAGLIASLNHAANLGLGQASYAQRMANDEAYNKNAQYINTIEAQNATGLMGAQQENASLLMQRAQLANSLRDLALRAYDAENTARANAISANTTNLANNLANIGRENFAMNQVNTNRSNLGYGTGLTGATTYTPGVGTSYEDYLKYLRDSKIQNG